MCLSIAISRPDDVLATGNHAGFQWHVIHNGMGNRCGYVRLPKGHPWHGMDDYNDIPCDVHGGLTFAEHDKPCDGDGPDDAFWIGFDCAHYNDAPDPELIPRNPEWQTEIGQRLMALARERGVIRSQAYVEGECKSLCEQAAAVGS